jgi:hypothetical protein
MRVKHHRSNTASRGSLPWRVQSLFLVLSIIVTVVDALSAVKSSSAITKSELAIDWTTHHTSTSASASTSTSTSQAKEEKKTPLTHTALFLPPEEYATDVTYWQKATNTRLQGYSNLQAVGQDWEDCFQSDLGDVDMQIRRASLVSPTCFVVQWNLTWVPPTLGWMESLAAANRWTPDYASYVHMSGERSTFSYVQVAKVFWEAFSTQRLQIPLACIEGTTTCTLDATSQLVTSIVEELSYAQDLNRGALQNRKCAQDLQLFLETGRRMPTSLPSSSSLSSSSSPSSSLINRNNNKEEDWDDVVATCLPWSSVPGMNAMDVDPNNSDEAWVPIAFLGGSALTLVLFAAILAPELIGQSLFHWPSAPSSTYSVPPSEWSSLY